MKRPAGMRTSWAAALLAITTGAIMTPAGSSSQDSEPLALAELAANPPPTPAITTKAAKRHQPARIPPPITTKPVNGRPAVIASGELADFNALPASRRKLLEIAIAVARDSPWLPYVYGGADPALGGMDCSGAMYFVMTKAGLTPPRTAAGQYRWLGDHNRLHLIPDDALTADHASLAWLRPADLLFWSTTRTVAGAKVFTITHVAMFLGREKKDGLRVMINSTDNRSYRGVKANGYGVYDFGLPRAQADAKLAAYGSPPGMAESARPAAPPER